jgi:hypothetical protein
MVVIIDPQNAGIAGNIVLISLNNVMKLANEEFRILLNTNYLKIS